MENIYTYNIGQLFNQVSEKYANRTALKYHQGTSYSYAELNRRANQFAEYLIEQDIKKGDVIAILNNKTLDGFSIMIACAKIGAIYTNLDFTNPWQRINKILTNCKPKLVFNDHGDFPFIEDIKSNFDVKVINLFSEEFLQEIKSKREENKSENQNNVVGSDPLYIMFTSGSTGFPKGAVMSHDNVLNFIKWGQSTFNVKQEDVFTNANPIYFDNSVFDFYTSLFSGASMVPISSEVAKDSKMLVNVVNQCQCTFWFSVPSLLIYLLTTKALKPTDFPSMTKIAFGGEGFSKPKLKQLFDLYGGRVALYNVYGPTECTCICSSYLISAKDFESLTELAPLGCLAPNFEYEILCNDENKNEGELALIGPNVGLGYYNDEERTNKSFIQNPRSKFLQRMYKTGDLVEKKEDGYLYFIGRVDNQIKHMGYRVELEEIEAAINSLNYVDEVGVIYRRLSNELGVIVAYLSLNSQHTETEIAADLEKILPVYMLPKKLVVMEKLPKNRNGKIDRTQLA